MKTLIKIAALAIIGVLIYNYFLGTPEEKATSEKVFTQVKEVGKSIGDLVKNERQKFREGKYDQAFEKLENAYDKLKGQVDAQSDEQRKLEELERQKEDLKEKKIAVEEELKKDSPDEEVIRNSPDFDEELKQLADETSKLLEQILKKKE